jgi:dephospho-CoA kinase
VLKIGLTGGIGSGKSIAANYFAKLKVPIIDADKIAHKLLRPQTDTYKKIVSHFGKSFLTTRNLIDRKKLRNIVFSNKKERAWLEKTLHPHIRTIMDKRAAKIKAPYCIMIIPLLFETKSPIKVNRILVIDCPQKLQIERVSRRDNNTAKQIQAIIKTQTRRDLRRQSADDIIRNTGSLCQLEKAVKNLHRSYLSYAQKYDTM